MPLAKSGKILAATQTDFSPDGFRSSNPTTPARQWVSMHPFCLGLATTSARAALRLKAGRQPYASARHALERSPGHGILGEAGSTLE
jgi:hypothetical protein